MIVYSAINQEVLQSVPAEATSILDVGCGNGAFGAALKARQQVTVDGITYSDIEAKQAALHLDRVYTGDLNRFDFTQLSRQYECIVCSHVLEHLAEPWLQVKALVSLLAPNGVMIIAVPNLLFFKQRWRLLRGQFKYSLDGGLMDITHLRFFDWQSVELLYRNADLMVVNKTAFGMFPQPLFRKLFPGLCQSVDRLMVRLFPGLFGLQFIIRLKHQLA